MTSNDPERSSRDPNTPIVEPNTGISKTAGHAIWQQPLLGLLSAVMQYGWLAILATAWLLVLVSICSFISLIYIFWLRKPTCD